MKKKRVFKIVLFSLLFIIIGIILVFFIYTSNYYHAKDVDSYMSSDDNVLVNTDKDKTIWFTPKDNTKLKDEAFVFYPGGLVEDSAYSPIMRMLASDGYVSAIVNMPFNLAFFNSNGAKNVINNNLKINDSDISYSNLKWYIGGHSLGGVFASRYYLANYQSLNGLVLMGSYADKDLSNTNGRVLSMYGSLDGVMNRENYDKNKANLVNLSEYIIDGGNHSYFGSYGVQKKDGEGTISAITQWEIVTQKIEEFMSI